MIHPYKDMDFIYARTICLTTVLRKINESDIFILHTFVLFCSENEAEIKMYVSPDPQITPPWIISLGH